MKSWTGCPCHTVEGALQRKVVDDVEEVLELRSIWPILFVHATLVMGCWRVLNAAASL